MKRLVPLLLALATAAPTVAHAQAYIAPPPPPPVYATPGPIPPHVYIRERIRWHFRRNRRRPYVIVPPVVAPPPVVIQSPPPPPPAPPCCYNGLPPQELVLVRPPPAVPMWRSRVGLGVHGTGQVLHDGWNHLGIGGEFLFRASRHLSTELSAEYDRSTAHVFERVDVPVTFGLRAYIGRPSWVASPYFVVAGGLVYASQNLKFTQDDAWYLDGQVGGGLEIRLGQHVAFTFDARLDMRKRTNTVAQSVVATHSINGKPVRPLGDEVGGQFRLGVAAYF